MLMIIGIFYKHNVYFLSRHINLPSAKVIIVHSKYELILVLPKFKFSYISDHSFFFGYSLDLRGDKF